MKKCFINCSKSYSSFILSKNILPVKYLAHFDFAFLSDIKSNFLDVYIQCDFYNFCNKYAYFAYLKIFFGFISF